MNYRSYLPSFLRSVATRYLIGGAVVFLMVVVLLIRHFSALGAPAATTGSTTPHVHVASVSELSSEAGPLSLIGTVKSESQATILAQTSGEVVSLSHQIGDHVYAGEIIGSFENSSQQAAVLQAEGSYESAQAALAKTTGATAANSEITSSQASVAEANAKASLASSLSATYAAFDDAVHAKADTLFNNPRDASPTLKSFTIADSQLATNIQNERSALAVTFSDAASAEDASASADIDSRALKMLSDAQVVETFLDNAITAINEAVPSNTISASEISAYQSTLAAARSEVVTAVSGLTSAKGAYDNAASGAATAANSAGVGTQSDIDSAQAAVKSAQGALSAARANLEKTIIRSPISATIVSLPITQGDYVSSFSQVAIVSNPSALYIDSEVTPDDAKMLAVGNTTTIAQNIPGVITFIAPALDPTTGKIEVKIGVTRNDNLTDGEVVPVSLARTKTSQVTPSNNSSAVTLSIPIVALKITPAGPAVFTVTASSTLLAHSVQLGSILSDRIVITSGLTPTLQIVSDARGLSEGQTVVIDPGTATTSTTTI
jgi:RND family efflux transporter MFP subunit